MQGSSLEAIQFASDHAAALEWMILMEEKLSLAVAVNADLPALLDHDRQHAVSQFCCIPSKHAHCQVMIRYLLCTGRLC